MLRTDHQLASSPVIVLPILPSWPAAESRPVPDERGAMPFVTAKDGEVLVDLVRELRGALVFESDGPSEVAR